MRTGSDVDTQDRGTPLARRLRQLREGQWPGKRITQQDLAQALHVSVPLISSWESTTNPKRPPAERLHAYANLFGRHQWLDPLALLMPDPDAAEQEVIGKLRAELIALAGQDPHIRVEPSRPPTISSGPWWFPDGAPITLVCAQLPDEMLNQIPYTRVDEPDYMELLTYSELDSMFELYGHLRAANPGSDVERRITTTIDNDEIQSHLVILGGVDWNVLTSTTLQQLGLPVRQIADWTTEDGQYFEVGEGDSTARHRSVLSRTGGRAALREDVALFVRAVNPFNAELTVTICSGMYGRGTYGAVRALTDKKFRNRNAAYVSTRFGGCEVYCILMRVPIVNGKTLTPDWSFGNQTLFEWSR